MKKLSVLIIALMLVGFSLAVSQEIHWADQKTVTIFPPDSLVTGEPIPDFYVVTYNVYLKSEDGTGEVFIEEIPSHIPDSTDYTVTIPVGVFFFGARAVAYVPGSSVGSVGEALWSENADPPFGLGNVPPLAAIPNMAVQ